MNAGADGIGRLEAVDNPFGRIAGVVLVKARNLALGCYSLSLDGLAQEGGALLRPLVECLELLAYFRIIPTGIEKALKGRLPKAGVIAKEIDGKLQGLRKHLNTHASHLSLGPEAIGHLVDLSAMRLRPVQEYNGAVLRTNLLMVLLYMIWLAIEGANCVSAGSDTVDDALGNTVMDIKKRSFVLFDEAFGQ